MTRGATILQGRDEVAAFLGWSVDKLQVLAGKYPPTGAKINGRWDWTQEGALLWKEFVAGQEHRHPEARRLRPEEPPALSEIVAREPCQGGEAGGLWGVFGGKAPANQKTVKNRV